MSSAHVVLDMRRHIAAGFAVILGLGLLTGCASATGTGASGTNSSAPVNVASSVGGGPSPAPSASAPQTSPPIVNPPGPSTNPQDGVTVVHGQLTQGVEPTCKLVTDDKVQYLLLAADTVKMPPVGASVVVTGQIAKGIMTHCQQGIPFAVTTIRQVVAPQGGVTMQPVTPQ
jgi:hypothetical protein